MASICNEPEREHKDEEEFGANEDEDRSAQVASIVRLEEVAVTTGEEVEDTILDLKSKLYRFDKDGSQWKERGTVKSGMTVQEHSGNKQEEKTKCGCRG